MTTGEEIFVDIPGYPDYKVSNFGTVVSYRTGNVKVLGGNIKREKNKSGGIKRVGREHTLQRPNSSKKDTVWLHIIVTKAFLGEMPDNHYVRHIDGDTLNNKLDNLEYVPIEHITPRFLATIKRERKYRYTRTEEQVRDIRNLYATGLFSLVEIANRHNISSISAVKKIISGKDRLDAGGPVFNISVKNPEIFIRLHNAIRYISELNDIQDVKNACNKILTYLG